MRQEYLLHNLFKKDVKKYFRDDPHLSLLEELIYVYQSPLERDIPVEKPGIYILTGGRQVGKSTLIKNIIKRLLLKKNSLAKRIFYLPCDLIERFQDLLLEIEAFLETLKPGEFFYLFVDEITYVREWDRCIKHLSDLGVFRSGSILLTGSDSLILKESIKRFPGRRGREFHQDFHFSSLSFSEYVRLVEPGLYKKLKVDKKDFLENIKIISSRIRPGMMERIYEIFEQYLVTGGILPALNDLAEKGYIHKNTYRVYYQWIVGDMLKHGKSESFLKEIIRALYERLAKQVSFNNITSATNIQHHSTIEDYLTILERMDVLFIQHALREDKLLPAPKKARKIHFNDPFIFQSLISWADQHEDSWNYFRKKIKDYHGLKSALIEGCISTLFKRKYPTYYIKSVQEVDIALVTGKTFLPIEIKWSMQLQRRELKQVVKYPKGIIGYKGVEFGRYKHLDVVPVPVLALSIT